MSMSLPFAVSLDLTYKCTMRCSHCFNSSGLDNPLSLLNIKQELTDSEWRSVAMSLADLKPSVVCFCGGEPLLRAGLILELTDILRKKLKDQVQINFVSNGELLTESLATEIANSSISNVQISLDGINSQECAVIRKKTTAYSSAIRAISMLRAKNVNVSVAFVPHKLNFRSLRTLAGQCSDMGVSTLRVQPLMLIGRALVELQHLELEPINYRYLISVIRELQSGNTLGSMNVEWGDPVEHLVRIAFELKQGKQVITQSVSIDAYGDISISPYMPIKFGNCIKHTLLEYWEAGLNTAWNIPYIMTLVSKIKTTSDLNFQSIDLTLPELNKEQPLYMDLMENVNE